MSKEKSNKDNGVVTQMTIYDYEDKYVHRENVRHVKFFARFLCALLGVFLLAVLALLCLKVVELNSYVGIAVAVVCAVVYVVVFVVPIAKLFRMGHFVTNVNSRFAKQAKKQNKLLRREIADKFIEVNSTVEGIGWYDDRLVGELAIAIHNNNEKQLRDTLTQLFNGSVKKSAHSLITKASLKAGTLSAVSQTDMIDSALVTIVNLQLIKDIVFLYGFRPSDSKLARIFVAVIRNALIAYGIGGLKMGNTVVRTMGDAVRSLPLFGSLISTLVDSSVQGMANAALTAVIGYQTIRYLNKEYRLQDILEDIQLETDKELETMCEEVGTELKKINKKSAAATA